MIVWQRDKNNMIKLIYVFKINLRVKTKSKTIKKN